VTDQLRRYLVRATRLGLISGLIALYTILIGVVANFQPRPVVQDVVGLGLLVPAMAMLILHYQAGRTPRQWPAAGSSRVHLVAAPLVSGVVGGLVLAAIVLFNALHGPTLVLPNLTLVPLGIVALGFGFPESVAVVVLLSTALGAAAAVLHLLNAPLRRAVLAGLSAILVLSLIEPLFRILLLQLANRLGVPAFNDLGVFFYLAGNVGLTQVAAILVLVVVGGAVLGWNYRAAIKARLPERARRGLTGVPERLTATHRRRVGTQSLLIATLGALLLILPTLLGTFLSEVAGTIGLYLLMGLGLNIVVGYAGLLDLGYVAFFAVGAYAAALLTSPASALGWELSLWLALPLIILVAALFGIAIGAPVLRLRGDYLAIVTLAFGEIVRFMLLSDWLRPWFGGAQGILAIPPPEIAGIRFFGPQQLYYPILLSVIIGGVIAWSLANSRVGRAWNAMREDEDVAEATGINTTRYKLLAFAFGAVFGCVAGAFLAVKLGSVFPHNLDLLISITVLALIILGGMGSIRGVIVGALVLVGLPELLREFGEYRLLIYGAVLVTMMLLRPEGLLPSATRRRELHEEEPEELQYLHEAGVDSGGPGIATAAP
jgi:branched-chain amino acid transport system permease protein